MNGKPNAPIDINGAMNKGFQPGEIIMKKHSFAPRSLLLAGKSGLRKPLGSV